MKIIWDDEPDETGGGFTVEGGQLNNPPKGWVEDKPDHWKPKWVPCRYRRLSKMFIHKKPVVVPFCLLPQFKCNVDYDTCDSCNLHKPPADFVRVNNMQTEDAPENIIVPLPIINYGDDEVFSQPNEITKTPWKPCKHRIQGTKEDCSGCKTLVCNCKECPLYEKVVFKRDCGSCEFRET